jgi:DNA-binding transcriptional ArsR family regulator
LSQCMRPATLLRDSSLLYGGVAMQLDKGLRALANPTRLRVLELLRDPSAFEGPRSADGRPLGVTAKALLKHLRCTQPSLNEQMAILIGLGLVESRKVGRWVVYTRDEERIRQLKQTIIDQLLPPAPAAPNI